MNPQDRANASGQPARPSEDSAAQKAPAASPLDSNQGPRRVETDDRPAAGSGRVGPGDGTGGSDAGGGPASEEASEAVREHSGGRLNRP